MTDQGLWCECRLPLKWQVLDAASLPPAVLEREALLLLTAINQTEAVPARWNPGRRPPSWT
jgi:hypothetical protein